MVLKFARSYICAVYNISYFCYLIKTLIFSTNQSIYQIQTLNRVIQSDHLTQCIHSIDSHNPVTLFNHPSRSLKTIADINVDRPLQSLTPLTQSLDPIQSSSLIMKCTYSIQSLNLIIHSINPINEFIHQIQSTNTIIISKRPFQSANPVTQFNNPIQTPNHSSHPSQSPNPFTQSHQ